MNNFTIEQPETQIQMPGLWFILDDNHNPVPCNDREVMAQWLGNRNRVGIRSTRQKAAEYKYWISTVFLCVEHMGGMFETMVFCDDDKAPGTGMPIRYHTYEEAVKGHKQLVRFVKQRKILKR